MRTAFVLTAALAALSLSACQKPANTAAANTAAPGDATTPAATAPSAPAPSGGETPLTEANAPHARPGLWKMRMTSSDNPRPHEYTECVTEADNKVNWTGKGPQERCHPTLTRGMDGTIHGSATCDLQGGVKMAFDVHASGDYNSHYTLHSDMLVSGAPLAQLNGKHTADVEGVWSGPCTK